MKALFLSLALLLSPFTAVRAEDGSPILYQFPSRNGHPLVLRDGRFGALAALQARLKQLLSATDPAAAHAIVVDGRFREADVMALQTVFGLPEFRAFAPPPGAPPRVTTAAWAALLGASPPPDVDARAMTLVLTFEATEFDRPASWNFCQNPAMGLDHRKEPRRPPCRTNDDSLLTWGPRGATLAAGSEIRAVLIDLDRTSPGLVPHEFGSESGSLERMLHLGAAPMVKQPTTQPVRERRNVSDLELFACDVWTNPARADAWAGALARLGALAPVQASYRRLYASSSSDGAKVAAFYSLYGALGVHPSEVDHAFFLDRATHTSGVFASKPFRPNTTGAIQSVAARVRSALASTALANWQVRRALSRVLATTKRGPDRNGRDVTYFVDATGESGLTAIERTNWRTRGALAASWVGLDDQRLMLLPFNVSAGDWVTRKAPAGTLSADERAHLCPDWVVSRKFID